MGKIYFFLTVCVGHEYTPPPREKVKRSACLAMRSGAGALIKRINYQNFAGCEAATITLTANYELFAEYFLHHFVGEKCNYSTVTFLGICFLNEKFNCFLNMFSSKLHVFE